MGASRLLSPLELSKLHDLLYTHHTVGQIEKWLRVIGVTGVSGRKGITTLRVLSEANARRASAAAGPR